MSDAVKADILPFYMVIDVSTSMSLNGKIDAANAILPAIGRVLQEHPLLNDKTRFCVIDFSDDARVVLPMCELLAEDVLPTMSVRGGTQYGKAFGLLRTQIEKDVRQLKADGYRVYRPAAFLLTDGEPTDMWQTEFDALIATQMYPKIIPLGVGGAGQAVLQQVVHPKTDSMRVFMVADGADGANAVEAMAKILLNTIMLSGASGGLILPAASQLPANVSATNGQGGAIFIDDDYLD